MKKISILLLALMGVIVSCDNKDELNAVQEEQKSMNKDYLGTMTVTFQAVDYDTDSVRISLTPNAAGDSVSIAFYQVKFVPQMPVKVDITVPGIAVSKTGQGAELFCDESIPLSAGGPTERYKVTSFQGQIIGDSISFSLNFGSYPTSYHGKLSVK